jgi:phosphoenolpyruvate---glycerone phosphotransferase subunit DhaL
MTFNKTVFAAMLQKASAAIEENKPLLTQLDSVAGDGDHGVSMSRAIGAAASAAGADGSLKELLHGVGWAVMCEDCGSTGPLVGSFFMGLSDGVDSDELDAAGVQKMFEAGLAGIAVHSKAAVGDKTMMDALIPAVGAMAGVEEIPAMLAAAATAADKGAEATVDMVAKFGRARNLGEKSRGHVDPGAKSISLIFVAFAEAVA